MKCPFMSQLSGQFLRNYGPSIVRQFGGYCPKLQSMGVAAEPATCPMTASYHTMSKDHDVKMLGESSKCPFLKDIANEKNDVITVPSEEVRNEIIEVSDKKPAENVFDYDAEFQQKIAEKKNNHLYRVFKRISRKADLFPMASEFTGRKKDVIVWCSNDYLGTSRHPRVLDSAIAALEQLGAGAGGTRNISGNTVLHEKLEEKVAWLHGKERGLVFTSCYNANETTLNTLGKLIKDLVIFSDAGNHASMIAGIKNSGATKVIFRHNDPEHLDMLMSQYPRSQPKLVAFETVHSMTGAVCPLDDLCEVTKKHGGLSFVDEVHAVGLYGMRGGGIADRDGLSHKIDIISGTFGKAFGNMGGYIAGPDLLVDFVRSFGSGFIFTTSLTPSVLAGSLAAIEVLSSPEGVALRAKHQEAVRYLRTSLMAAGLPVEHCPSHILPIHVGDPAKANEISDRLLHDYGHYVQAICSPTVPMGSEKLRVAVTPGHTPAMMDLFRDALLEVWGKLNLPTDNLCTKECKFCQQPRIFDALESRTVPLKQCSKPYCPSIAIPA